MPRGEVDLWERNTPRTRPRDATASRKRGFGVRRRAAAIETLRERGFTEATLWTSKDNHRPRRIYEAAGWRLDGATRDKQWREASVRDLRYRIRL